MKNSCHVDEKSTTSQIEKSYPSACQILIKVDDCGICRKEEWECHE